MLMVFGAGSSVKFSLGFLFPQAASKVDLWGKKKNQNATVQILCVTHYPVPKILNKIILNLFFGPLK